MNKYLITYKRNDMPEGYVGATTKWSNSEKDALKLMLSTMPKKDSKAVVFKRGGGGEILSVKEVPNVI
jgi:hypothetical protein